MCKSSRIRRLALLGQLGRPAALALALAALVTLFSAGSTAAQLTTGRAIVPGNPPPSATGTPAGGTLPEIPSPGRMVATLVPATGGRNAPAVPTPGLLTQAADD